MSFLRRFVLWVLGIVVLGYVFQAVYLVKKIISRLEMRNFSC